MDSFKRKFISKSFLSLSALAFILLFLSQQAPAKSLMCWNVYSKMTQKPVVKAKILNHDRLGSISFSDLVAVNMSKEPSTLKTVFAEKKINSSQKKAYQNQFKISREAQLILPQNLDSKKLSSYHFEETSGRKVNGILMLKNTKSNENYKIKLFCQSI